MRLGFVVNPVAGMGGRVGLKGSDGAETLRRAKELGATESSPERATEALRHLASLRGELEILTYPGEMGEYEARLAGFEPKVLGKIKEGATTSADTKAAASEMVNLWLQNHNAKVWPLATAALKIEKTQDDRSKDERSQENRHPERSEGSRAQIQLGRSFAALRMTRYLPGHERLQSQNTR